MSEEHKRWEESDPTTPLHELRKKYKVEPTSPSLCDQIKVHSEERSSSILWKDMETMRKDCEITMNMRIEPINCTKDNEIMNTKIELIRKNIEAITKDNEIMDTKIELLRKDTETIRKDMETFRKVNEIMDAKIESIMRNVEIIRKIPLLEVRGHFRNDPYFIP